VAAAVRRWRLETGAADTDGKHEMIERGTRLYVHLDERRLAEAPEPGESWTDTLTSSIAFEPGEDLHLLTVVYTTGNSFGRSPEMLYECIDIYKDQALAAEQAKIIRAHYQQAKSPVRNRDMSYDDRMQVAIKLGSGEDLVCQGPWLGYFERIEEIEVSRVHLGAKAVLKF
jgi:hypothetical protein